MNSTEMIKFDPIHKTDLQKIVDWNADKSADDLLQWAGPMYHHPLTLDQLENYFSNEVQKDNSKISVYKIRLVSTSQTIGTIELRETDSDNKIGRICRLLIGETDNRGKGIGTNVLKEALRIGFEEKDFNKITLGVFDFNLSAIKCYEKVGFAKEKLIKNARKSATGYWNLYEMAITKQNWQVGKL